MIKYFNTEADYEAAVKSSFESEIALVGADNQVHFDGANVVVGAASAKTGSIVVLDGNSAMHFIAADTYKSDSFMSNYTVVGVVAVGVDHDLYRGKLLVVHKTNASKKWSNIYSWRLTGYTCDGTARTGVLSIRSASDSWGANVQYTISYNAATVADLVEQLNTYFQANAPFTTQSWVAEGVDTDNDNVVDAIDLKCLFVDYRQASYNTATSGFSMSANFLPEIAASSAMYRLNGQRSGEGTITNWERAIKYFSADISSTTYNPNADVTSVKRSYPICKPAYLGTSAYQSDHCAFLRSVYGAGEAGWLKFMKSFLPVKPTAYGPMGDKDAYGDGKTNTYLMEGKTFTQQDNTVIAVHPAADYCAAVSYNHELLNHGNWFLPDVDDVFSIMRDIKYGTDVSRNADPINKALYAIGGSAISNGSYVWSSSRYSAYYAWYSNGGFGCANGYSMCSAYLAVPCVLLNVDEVDA